MYRILAVVLFCLGLFCLGQSSRAQLTLMGIGRGGAGGGGAFSPSCTASTNWLARATNVVLTADKINYDNLLCGLNTDGVLAKLDALYILAAVDQTTAKLNLLSASFPLTAVGTVSFAAYIGYTGDAATFVLDTAFVPSTGGTQYTLNSASFGLYDRTNPGLFNGIPFGSDNLVNNQLAMQRTTGGLLCTVNGGSATTGVAMANDQGFWICTRTSSSSVSGSMNGGAGIPTASTSATLDNISQAIFARHDLAGANYSGFTSDQLTAAFIGGALTDPNIASLSSRVNTYMTAYSINVYP